MKKILSFSFIFYFLFLSGCGTRYNGVKEFYEVNDVKSEVTIIDCEKPQVEHVSLFGTENEYKEFLKKMNARGYILVSHSIYSGGFEWDIDEQAYHVAKKNNICLATYDVKITNSIDTIKPYTNYHTDEFGNFYTTTNYYPATIYTAEHIVLFWKKYKFNSSEADALILKAKQGDVSSQGLLGFLYYQGEELGQDYEKAKYWFEKASEQGDNGASFYLANMYYQGKGVEQDFVKAKELFIQSANNGNVFACGMLGLIYEYGKKGVSKNISQAQKWYKEMCNRGEKHGCDKYKELSMAK